MFPESEQGADAGRRRSPASPELALAPEWNPEFTRRSEPGYERCSKHLELSQAYHEGLLLLDGLEASVTELGGSVDELEVDLLLSATVGLDQQRLETQTRLI